RACRRSGTPWQEGVGRRDRSSCVLPDSPRVPPRSPLHLAPTPRSAPRGAAWYCRGLRRARFAEIRTSCRPRAHTLEIRAGRQAEGALTTGLAFAVGFSICDVSELGSSSVVLLYPRCC